jgi:hypothetical protein
MCYNNNVIKGRKTLTNQKGFDTMATKKITKKDRFTTLLSIPAVAEDADMVAFIEHEIELLDKKNSGERKPTAKQAEKTAHDAELRSAIVNEMEMDTLYSASDLIKSLPTLSAEPDLSPAKVSYLMRALVDDGSVAKVLDKRHTFYKLAD